MYDLEHLSLRQMTECGAALRTLHRGAASITEVCDRIVTHLYDNLRDGTGKACVMVRAYKTDVLDDLDAGQQQFARDLLSAHLPSDTKCLTLMATRGAEPAWNAVTSSRGHRVIPLLDAEAVERLPMVAQLVRQLGLEVSSILAPDDRVIMDMQQRSFNVFYVPEAAGSPYIPAQADFVERYGVRSVLGFGSVLPDGELFAVILFARLRIPRETAEQFRPLALAAKLSILPFVNRPGHEVHHA